MAEVLNNEQLKEKYAYLLRNEEVRELCCWNLTNTGEKLDDEAYVIKAKQSIEDFAEIINEAIDSISS